jgi:hypothetical protein
MNGLDHNLAFVPASSLLLVCTFRLIGDCWLSSSRHDRYHLPGAKLTKSMSWWS